MLYAYICAYIAPDPYDATLRKSEGRIEGKCEEFKQLLIGCMSQLQKAHEISAEPRKNMERADEEVRKAADKATRQKSEDADLESNSGEQDTSGTDDTGLDGIPGLSEEEWEIAKLQSQKEDWGALSWLTAMPDDYHQRSLDPVGAECGSGSAPPGLVFD